jgi:hypothetical protein
VYWADGLAMKMPALLTSVSMRPNRAMPSDITRSAVFRSAMSPGTARTSSSFDGLIERAAGLQLEAKNSRQHGHPFGGRRNRLI